MITLGTGDIRDSLSEIRDMDEVIQANQVAGVCDIIAEVEAQSEQALLMIVTDNIRSKPGVTRTRTCVVRN